MARPNGTSGATDAGDGHRLSAIIIAQDEADRIGRAIASLAFADEVIVVDGGSRDATVAVAERAGARVVRHPWSGYGAQVRFAVAQTSGDWILRLDADEVVPPELQAEIRAVLAQPERREVGYQVGFVAIMYGRPLRYCVRQSARNVRLWRRDSATISDRAVHERVFFHDPAAVVGRLHARFLHYSWRDLPHMIGKSVRYGQLNAAEIIKAGRRRRWPALTMVTAFPIKFAGIFFLRRGFLDGPRGFIAAMVRSFEVFVREASLWLHQSGLAEQSPSQRPDTATGPPSQSEQEQTGPVA